MKRKCKYCGEKYEPKFNSLEPCPKKECKVLFFSDNQAKIIARAKKQAEKQDKLAKKEAKKGLLTLTDYEKILQKEINSIIRLIDNGCTCISCGKLKRGFAGHYHSTGSNKSLTFHLDNIHIQDYSCNGEKGGNQIAYGRGLISWYGKEYKEYVEFDLVRTYQVMKWNKQSLSDWTKIAREIVSELKEQDGVYDAKTRLKLRSIYNKRLGIYK